ncbi:MAG TPA: dTMP kinase [Anaerolineales bacterium]|nr:dTMP kinase [Anaerolineales bacterium]
MEISENSISTSTSRHPESVYISIEGPDGVGKSTLVNHLKEYFIESGKNVIAIKEPGSTPIGSLIREILLKEKLPLDTQIEYFIANRVLLHALIVRPTLKKKTIILSDRCVMSSLVYQGLMTGRFHEVMERHKSIEEFIWPDLTIVCTVPVEIAMKRLGKRQNKDDNESNWIDQESLEFHTNIHQHFIEADQWWDRPIAFLDLNRPLEESLEEAVRIIQSFSGWKRNR